MSASEGIVWKRFTSQKGRPYEIGILPQDSSSGGLDGGDSDAKAVKFMPRAEGYPFGMDLDWKVASADASNEWKDTSSDVNNTARITRYNLYKYGPGNTHYGYMLQITNEDAYRYYLIDAEGDIYSLSTWCSGDHYLRYNSSNPAIVHISGH